MRLKKVLFVFFLFQSLLLSASSSKVTYSEAISVYNKELIVQKNNHWLTSKSMIYKWGKTEFNNSKEWNLFLEFCLNEVRTESESQYFMLCFDLGENLSLIEAHKDAFPFLLRVDDYVKGKSPIEIPYYYIFQNRIGLVYYNFKRFYLAKKHFHLLINDQNTPINLRINCYNSIGLIYRSTNLDSSMVYFENALSLAHKNNKQDLIGVVSGNLGCCYYKQKKLNLAEKLIMFDFENSCKYKDWESAMNSLIFLVKIDLDRQNLIKAKIKLKQVEQMMQNNYHGLNVKLSFWEAMTLFEEKSGNFPSAFSAQKNYLGYLNTINEQSQLVNFHNIEFQIQFEKKQSQIKLIDSKKKRAEQILILSISIIFLIVFALMIIIRQITFKRRKEREVLTLQKLLVEDELKSIDSQLRLVLSNLSEKNNLINELKEEIEQKTAANASLPPTAEQLQWLDKLQSFRLLTNDDWDVFRKLFERLHPGFFERFQQLSQDISKADLRLASLIRLKSSTNEIARILGISIESVQRTNLRLRKKINIERPSELDSMIQSL